MEELYKIPDLKVEFDEPMKKHTSLGVGGNAKYLVTARCLTALRDAVELFTEKGIKYKVVGNGTNLLVSDLGYDGAIIKLSLNDIYTTSTGIRAMAGANLRTLAEFCFSHGLKGAEALWSIPAQVGGAVVMNAGAFNQTISDYITTVECLSSGKIVKYDKDECEFSYRTSRFQKTPSVIVAVNFCFPNKPKDESDEFFRKIEKIRKENFPLGRTCGSIFRNPNGDYAGRLIELAGLKGYKIGGASVSERHANFIVCDKTATATDVDLLITEIKRSVKSKFRITLKEEVERLGVF